MAKAKGEGRLVKVDELPRRTRQSKYGRVIDEFMAGDMAYARYESNGRPDAVATSLRAAARRRGAPVKVTVIGGEVYLARI
ncbi:MAG TPA: hypothetical protein PLB30_01935 [Thermoleophilia bacterium]|nr:hypothetical protein [Thermoleophilia bacterium]HQG02942.1 hypothetical protein [Thermoleophilia bacterium]HQG54201.1 hypothetical protein [Thermoleophilia bacterium]HQJ97300.1 hypothetical protein [Thermoleophilia bacterium]